MFTHAFSDQIRRSLAEMRNAGRYKQERLIDSTQSTTVTLKDGRTVINLCANNYLGLADHPEVIEASRQGLDRWGYGMASVRFICGTQTLHRQLEERLSRFLGTEDTLLYSSCFDANGGLFETLLGPEDAIISDQLNHASIIDGIRLCKARRHRYANNRHDDLDAQLRQAKADGARHLMVATDGVFSMDGVIAELAGLCRICEKHQALVMIDDSHAVGVLGPRGRGTHEHAGVIDRVDLITGTLGKALGGASGGYTSGKKEIIDLLRQRSRPYLFSNSLAPGIASATLKILDILESTTEHRDRLEANTRWFRQAMTAAGFTLAGADHPITPVMLGDARLSLIFAEKLLERGVYAIGFFHPVVPHGSARIRTQISAAHTSAQLEQAVQAFIDVKKELGL